MPIVLVLIPFCACSLRCEQFAQISPAVAAMEVAVLGIGSFRTHPFVEAVARIAVLAEEVHGVHPHIQESSGCLEKEHPSNALPMVGSKDIDLVKVALVFNGIWIGSRFDSGESYKRAVFILNQERRVVGRILAQNRAPLTFAKRGVGAAAMSFAKGLNVKFSKLRGVSENRIAETIRHAHIMCASACFDLLVEGSIPSGLTTFLQNHWEIRVAGVRRDRPSGRPKGRLCLF
jgi:hypothetical protein